MFIADLDNVSIFWYSIIICTGTLMVLHYQTFIEKFKSCPVTLAYGKSGTGKTTALHCGLGLVGADNFRFFHNLSCQSVSIVLSYQCSHGLG